MYNNKNNNLTQITQLKLRNQLRICNSIILQ
jgi:hypothetical protein